mgnify:CR=1 FL=1
MPLTNREKDAKIQSFQDRKDAIQATFDSRDVNNVRASLGDMKSLLGEMQTFLNSGELNAANATQKAKLERLQKDCDKLEVNMTAMVEASHKAKTKRF